MSCTLPDDGSSTLVQYIWHKYITTDKTIPLAFWDIVQAPNTTAGFPFPDYEMTFDKETVSSNLTIASVGLQDDGKYLCATSYIPTPRGGSPKAELRLIVTGIEHSQIFISISSLFFGDSSGSLEYRRTLFIHTPCRVSL